MKPITPKKLALAATTLRRLNDRDLAKAVGGHIVYTLTCDICFRTLQASCLSKC